MTTIKNFEDFVTNEKKKDKWIQDAKIKKGGLKNQLGYDKDEKIPAGVEKKIKTAKVGSDVTAKGEKKKVTPLMKKRDNLADTFKKMGKKKKDK